MDFTPFASQYDQTPGPTGDQLGPVTENQMNTQTY